MSRALMLTLGLLMASSVGLIMPASAQGNPLPAVTLDCPSGSIEIDVSPSGNAPFSLVCELENPSSLDETIEISTDIDVNEISLSSSESSVDLAAGESTFVSFTFSADVRTSVVSGDFSLGAKVTSAKVPLIGTAIPLQGPLATEDFHNGSASTKEFHNPILEVKDKSTRQVDSGGSLSISFTVLNDGNSDDTIEVEITNLKELETEGFKVKGDPFYRVSLVAGGTSPKANFSIECPSGSSSQTSISVKIEAVSFTNPSDSTVSMAEIDVQVSAEESGGLGLAGTGLEVFEDENTQLFLMVGGGGLGVLIILVVFLKMTRKSKKEKPRKRTSSVVEVPDDEDDEDDFDEFDEAFSDLDGFDEFDEAFSDL